MSIAEFKIQLEKRTVAFLVMAVPWREAIGMRNIIAHAYMKTDYNRVWQTVTSDFPDLESLLMDIQAAYPWPLS